jgi:5-amino-6-(5-phosphoribosylamino)uracil reductase
MIVYGPGSPFELFFDADGTASELGLPEPFRLVYQGDWVLPDPADGVYCYSNFVMSHDGRVSFTVPGHEGGGDVSDFNPHDKWLMGLLRARADAVIVGANTLRTESNHLWTSEFIFPADADGFAELRRLEGRENTPLQVFVTRTGDVTPEAAVFQHRELTSVILTTRQGANRVAALGLTAVDTIIAGDDEVDLPRAIAKLRKRYGVDTLLAEGGPRVYGAFVSSGVLDEEFLTLSPVLIGSDTDCPRPGLIEGLALPPGSPHRAKPLSVRRAGDHLFVRSAVSGAGPTAPGKNRT